MIRLIVDSEILHDDIIGADVIETSDKETAFEYYMNRNGRCYFRNTFKKISILSKDLFPFMQKAKYGEMFTMKTYIK